MNSSDIRSRKQDHVTLAVDHDVRFRARTRGFESVVLIYNALPEIDYSTIDTTTVIAGRSLGLPLIISGMTGGYDQAESINAMLAEVCSSMGIGMGVGSMRAALERPELARTYRSILANRPPLVLANVGAVQCGRWHADGVLVERCTALVDMIEADMLAVHLNPLQELVQPEGEPCFSGVTAALSALATTLSVPIIVKEVGAGLSRHVVLRLLDAGIRHIDVAGAGGTSWSGIEILRHPNPDDVDHLWDVGIPTRDALIDAAPLCRSKGATLYASGGITSGSDVAKALALGAHACGAARPLLQAAMKGGATGLHSVLSTWELHLRQWMFLTGSARIADLHHVPYRLNH
ncbi:MAG: type 2 isopentenyl-diphosphate Delta-isomerase [Candidatus Kapabacteria bacterium]|nr:type 2 isopentenyl-diphosphate Delta-isomerase [Candidatus Kapabacteria bacterium]